jgi:hypothetical protein
MTTTWTEDLTKLSVEEVVSLEVQNREWGKGLRLGTAALVNSRLAKKITTEEYAVSRQRNKEEAAEYRRRTFLLMDEIVKRP